MANKLGILTIFSGKPEILVGKSMVRAVAFGNLQKMWAVISGDKIFLVFLVCSAYMDLLCSLSFSHHVKFYSSMFLHMISTRMVCVNRRHPWNTKSTLACDSTLSKKRTN